MKFKEVAFYAKVQEFEFCLGPVVWQLIGMKISDFLLFSPNFILSYLKEIPLTSQHPEDIAGSF